MDLCDVVWTEKKIEAVVERYVVKCADMVRIFLVRPGKHWFVQVWIQMMQISAVELLCVYLHIRYGGDVSQSQSLHPETSRVRSLKAAFHTQRFIDTLN